MHKSGTVAFLAYCRDSRKYIGHIFKEKTVDISTVIEMINDVFPPDFDLIGDYSVKYARRIDYDFMTQEAYMQEHQTFQTLLNIN